MAEVQEATASDAYGEEVGTEGALEEQHTAVLEEDANVVEAEQALEYEHEGEMEGEEGEGMEYMGEEGDDALYETSGSSVRLYEQALDHIRRRRELMTYIDSECTFQPRINSRRSTASRATTDEFGAEAGAFERLYSAAKERDMKLKERASRLDDECTFRPSVSGRHSLTRMSVDGTGRSTFEVLYEKAKEIEVRREQQRRERELAGCTFAPKLTHKAEALRRPGSAVDRLYNPAAVRERNAKERNDPDMRISSSLTFKPATTPSRVRSHLESSSAMSGSVPVYERLSMSAQKKRAELDAARKRKEDTERATCTFKPNLSASKHSARLVGISSSDHDRSVEGSSDPYTRLYAHALERVQRLQEEPRPEDLGCTFKPAISSVSRRISETMRDPSTVDLPRHYMLYEDGLQKQQARSMEAANKGGAITEDDVANCTFHPAVSPLPAHTAASIPVYDRLYENARAKQITLAAAASGVVLPTSPVYMQERFGSEEAAHSEAASRTGGAPPGSSAGSKEMFYI